MHYYIRFFPTRLLAATKEPMPKPWREISYKTFWHFHETFTKGR